MSKDIKLILGGTSSSSEATHTVKPGITFPNSLTAQGLKADYLLPGIAFDAALVWNSEIRSYALTELAFRAETEVGIGATMLRKLPLSGVREAVIRQALPRKPGDIYGRKAPEDYTALKTGKLTDELLYEVAVRAAVRQGLYGDPNREVMECFDVPQRTATHWISKARARGFLD